MSHPNPKKFEEALGILQEECAEVIVEVSKILRFGIDSHHSLNGISHRKLLETELGDVLALVEILIEQGIVNRDKLNTAIENKKLKLEQWSSIYEEEE